MGSGPDEVEVQRARGLAEDLINTVREQYEVHVSGVPPPSAAIHYQLQPPSAPPAQQPLQITVPPPPPGQMFGPPGMTGPPGIGMTGPPGTAFSMPPGFSAPPPPPQQFCISPPFSTPIRRNCMSVTDLYVRWSILWTKLASTPWSTRISSTSPSTPSTPSPTSSASASASSSSWKRVCAC